MTHSLALEEADVNDGRVEIYELEDKNFKYELVFEFRLCPVHLCNKMHALHHLMTVSLYHHHRPKQLQMLAAKLYLVLNRYEQMLLVAVTVATCRCKNN